MVIWFLLGVLLGGCIGFLVGVVVGLVAAQRAEPKSHSRAPPQSQSPSNESDPRPRWRITYHDGKRIRTITAFGNSEGDAVQDAITQHAMRYASIQSIEREVT